MNVEAAGADSGAAPPAAELVGAAVTTPPAAEDACMPARGGSAAVSVHDELRVPIEVGTAVEVDVSTQEADGAETSSHQAGATD